jgi:hypothetical protein
MDMTGIPPVASFDWRRIPARRVDRWYVGLDIGQSVDPSAVCALHHIVTPLDTWTPNAKTKTWRQDSVERFLVRHLARLPLQMPYPEQVEHVANLLARDPLNRAEFALDFTGVGRPCADLFVRAGLRPMCVLITAGSEVTNPEPDIWHVPKQTLISGLETRLHTEELQFAATLTESQALENELQNFARRVSDTGRVTWSARSGEHDDLILSVSIALFASTNRHYTSSEPLMF